MITLEIVSTPDRSGSPYEHITVRGSTVDNPELLMEILEKIQELGKPRSVAEVTEDRDFATKVTVHTGYLRIGRIKK